MARSSLAVATIVVPAVSMISFFGIACALVVATTYGLGSHIDQGISIDDTVRLLKATGRSLLAQDEDIDCIGGP
ncbi:hypothetical protein TWF694_002193 [Orbilia ellipsospora]|uniref:Uncharacterized protein n=1 Tax=Orbilia ellipsospora TaxID=2528407 RepID=A0AAV9X559_9PEZI